jgi:hypothetical protein
MGGTFGITFKELESFFSILSLHRDVVLDPALPRLARTLGYFTPPLPLVAEHIPSNIYNFDLVMNYVATTLDPRNEHYALADSPWLTSLSKRCKPLLQYSSVRRGRQVVIPAIGDRESNVDLLISHQTQEQNLWVLLLRLGALAACPSTSKTFRTSSKPTWALEICSSFAHNQVCCNLLGFRIRVLISIQALLSISSISSPARKHPGYPAPSFTGAKSAAHRRGHHPLTTPYPSV